MGACWLTTWANNTTSNSERLLGLNRRMQFTGYKDPRGYPEIESSARHCGEIDWLPLRADAMPPARVVVKTSKKDVGVWREYVSWFGSFVDLEGSKVMVLGSGSRSLSMTVQSDFTTWVLNERMLERAFWILSRTSLLLGNLLKSENRDLYERRDGTYSMMNSCRLSVICIYKWGWFWAGIVLSCGKLLKLACRKENRPETGMKWDCSHISHCIAVSMWTVFKVVIASSRNLHVCVVCSHGVPCVVLSQWC